MVSCISCPYCKKNKNARNTIYVSIIREQDCVFVQCTVFGQSSLAVFTVRVHFFCWFRQKQRREISQGSNGERRLVFQVLMGGGNEAEGYGLRMLNSRLAS